MTRQTMYLRMVTASLVRRRSRMLVAMLAITVGAMILSGLVTIYYDVPRQMGAQFRSYGANMILVPAEGDAGLSRDDIDAAVSHIPSDKLVGVAAYHYDSVRLNGTPVVVAGGDLDATRATSPYWYVDGEWPSASGEVLVGKEEAEFFSLAPGDTITLTYTPEGPAATSGAATAADDGAANEDAGTTGDDADQGLSPSDADATASADDGRASGTSDAAAAAGGVAAGGSADDAAGAVGGTASVIDINAADGAATDGNGAGAGSTSTDANADTDTDADADAEERAEAGAATAEASDAAATSADDDADAAAGDATTLDLTADFTVSGILDTGGNEERYLFMSAADLADLTQTEPLFDVAEVSVQASGGELAGYAEAIDAAGVGVTAQLVKRVSESEAAVLSKLQALVLIVTVIVLALTMICVATTMTAVVTERRREIGLRKALGASNRSITFEFMGEGLLLGAVGGVLGSLLGFLFAQGVSQSVFNSAISFQPLLVPITILVAVAVTALACLLPVRNATNVDPALVLKGE